MSGFRLRLRQGGVGDAVALSALVRDLALVAPGARVAVTATLAAEVFRHDPRVVAADPGMVDVPIDLRHGTEAAKTDRSLRYVGFAHEEFRKATGITVPLTDPRPELVLGPDEQASPERGPYAVLAAGAKYDMPVKRAPERYWADVVRLHPARWVQVGVLHDGRLPHIQPAVPGTENRLGRTSLRDLFRLVAHADAVACHCSLPMLVAAAFGVPCVVAAGGREAPWLFDGLGVNYLHTVGTMDCCRDRGCHASSAARADTGTPMPDGWLCADRVRVGTGWFGRCLAEADPAAAAAALAAAKSARRPRSQ